MVILKAKSRILDENRDYGGKKLILFKKNWNSGRKSIFSVEIDAKIELWVWESGFWVQKVDFGFKRNDFGLRIFFSMEHGDFRKKNDDFGVKIGDFGRETASFDA